MVRGFTCCSVNCWGLADVKKRKDVFNFLRSKHFSVYFLQDTHFTKEKELLIRAEWGFECIFNCNNSQSRGVAILLNNNFEYKIHTIFRGDGGNLLILDITICNIRLTLVNLYGPNSDNPDFYKLILQQIKCFNNKYYIFGGDWNLVLNPDIDTHNYVNVNNPNARDEVLEIIGELDLVDIWRDHNPDLHNYTWRRNKPLKQARLDFFLISDNLYSSVLNYNIHCGYRTDHSIVSLKFEFMDNESHNTYWKFNNSLLKNKIYITTIQNVISDVKRQYAALVYNMDAIDNIPLSEINFIINDQLFLEVLLMEIRGKTISYSSYLKKQSSKLEKQLIKEIEILENNNNIDFETIQTKRKELESMRQKKMEGVYIRSRAKWIDEGERISNYFCNLENRNFISKSITQIEKEDGSIITEKNEIINETKHFYQNLYSSKEDGVCDTDLNDLLLDEDLNKLNKEQADDLEGLLTYEELSNALKRSKNNKSPGSDGFSAEFLKMFWNDIGYFILRSVNYAFINGELSITQKLGIITCIPKGDKPKRFLTNWRPISLLNTIYKLASACISERLKTVLHFLINEDQTGFMPNRYIGDNIRILYDILYYTETENIPGMFLRVDFEKAFDSISWSFINKTLDFFGFGQDIKRWINVFYKNITSRVIVNGNVSSSFNIYRGCRQGDPLSPYIFLLCVEILAGLVRTNKKIRGISINNKEYIISQYADDTDFILDGSKISFEETIGTLNTFAKLSGLNINYDKFEVVWIGSCRHSPVRYLQHLNLKWNPSSFKALGIIFSIDIAEMTKLNYNSKLFEIKQIINKWMKRILTPPGRIAIIKALLISKLNYLLLTLPNPSKSFQNELNKLLFKFVWNQKPDRIKRKTLCKSVKEGGLGMIDIFNYIKALKITWIRKLETKDPKWKPILFASTPQLNNISVFGNDFPQKCF